MDRYLAIWLETLPAVDTLFLDQVCAAVWMQVNGGVGTGRPDLECCPCLCQDRNWHHRGKQFLHEPIIAHCSMGQERLLNFEQCLPDGIKASLLQSNSECGISKQQSNDLLAMHCSEELIRAQLPCPYCAICLCQAEENLVLQRQE